MQEFLAPIIKKSKHSIESFISAAELNRSLYYRGIREPKKFFTDENLHKMASVLKLTEEQEKQLFELRELPDPTQGKINKLIYEILFSNPYAYNPENLFEFNLYEKGEDIVRQMSPELLSKYIIQNSIANIEKKYPQIKLCRHSFHIIIYNSVSESILNALSEFFLSLEKESPKSDITSLRIAHFMQPQEKDVFSRLNFFNKIMPMISIFSDYSYDEEILSDPIWNANDNLCLIKYKIHDVNDQKNSFIKYFLLNITNENKIYMTSFDDEHIYKYFRIDARTFTFGRKSVNNALETTYKYLKASVSSKKILLHSDFCFDNIAQKSWKEVFNRASEQVKGKIAYICDPENFHSDLNIEQKIAVGLENIGKRYDVNDAMEAINILFAAGLDEFIKNQYISDFDIFSPDDQNIKIGELVKFNTTEIICHLKEIQKQLGDNAPPNKQRYYLVRNYFKTILNSFVMFQDNFFAPLSPKSMHRLAGASYYEEKDVINVIFAYVLNELIAKRNAPDSILMSDNEAFEYIEMHIKTLETLPT